MVRILLLLQIQVIPAGGETTLFKQFFSDWKDKDETTGPSKAYTIGRIAKVEQIPFDASKLHTDTTMAAHHGMVDSGKGKVKVGALERLLAEALRHEEADRGLVFRSGVWRKVTRWLWIPPPTVSSTAETVTSSSTPTTREAERSTSSTPGQDLHRTLGRHPRLPPHQPVHVCFRQGLKSTQDELTASAYLTVQLDDSMGGSPVQVRARSHT